MLGWLRSLWNWGISGIDDLWRKVLSIFQAVYSYIDSWITAVANYLGQLWHDFIAFVNSVVKWVNSVTLALENWVIKLYHDVESWVSGLFTQLYNYAVGLYHWALSQLDKLGNLIQYVWNQLLSWVINNIWDPLYNFISGAYKWITTNGYYVFYLLTHPDKLAQLLGSYLLREWLNLSRKYGGAVGRWLVHSMLGMGSEIVGLFADMLAKII